VKEVLALSVPSSIRKCYQNAGLSGYAETDPEQPPASSGFVDRPLLTVPIGIEH
jgi:hypothetical protein